MCCNDVIVVEDEGFFCGDNFLMSSCCLNCGLNGEMRVLFLLCRYFCCCMGCEDGLVFCLICNIFKKNRIEVFVF